MTALEHILYHTRARPSGPGRWQGLCPAHEDRTPSLSIRLTPDGLILLHCFAGCPTEAILAALNLGWRDLFPDGDWKSFPYLPPLRREPEPKPDEARKKVLERLWEEAIPLDRKGAEVGRRYLEVRGLDPSKLLPVGLRLHPSLPYREGERVLGRFPALLARVEHPRWGLVALHRTYLDPHGRGKASVPSPKKLTSPVFPGATRGAAIRLYPLEGEELGLAEGIETALAVHEATGLPVWATVSAGGMEALLLPPGVKRVLIAADHDPRGLEAAQNLAMRLFLKGLRTSLAVPSREGLDWADVLKGAKEELTQPPQGEEAQGAA
ncbi:toprim domain-containing protein [Thermus sp.]|uniref:DUF7146 domain-containing protein n=1 Tax=Thermus sp. TaxID=275 RepID=UPI00298F16EF|nr:toprim domain-containing protein [Thermus sp.]MDW8356793.1 toprim domain-containing protein [Thermus sp.]